MRVLSIDDVIHLIDREASRRLPADDRVATVRHSLGLVEPPGAEAELRQTHGGDHIVGSQVLVPYEDQYTFHMPAERREDGSFGAFLHNPERNQGIFWRLDRLEIQGSDVDLVVARNGEERVLTQAIYREDERLSAYFWSRGGTYDFERRPAGAPSTFFPRGQYPAGRYEYRRPPTGRDGWPIASPAEVGITLEPIRRLIEEHFSAPPTSVRDVHPHGLLIARHGKLVFEEYFHGFHRDRPHDTRSASKSVTAVLAGAAIEAGLPLAASTPVYETLRPGSASAAEDPRRSRMQLEHLLTMSSGLACDDSDPDSPGNEETMQEQTEQPDWYAYTLDLPMAGEPGEQAFYCSATANLAGAVISAATGETLPDLFQRLVAEPLEVGRYHLPITPTGEVYSGGGIHWLPRDFMKIGQLMLDGGTWKGRRVVSEAWTQASTAPLRELRERGYGYLWWSMEYPYKDRSVWAFFASGNGGQLVIGVPELDLVVAFFAGNYSDRTSRRYREEFFPKYILPAVRRRIQTSSRPETPAGAQPGKLQLDRGSPQPADHRADRHRQELPGVRIRRARLPTRSHRALLPHLPAAPRGRRRSR